MKIALLLSYLSPSNGGLSHAIPGLAKALHSFIDNDIHIVGLSDLREPMLWQDWGEKVHPHHVLGLRAFGYAPAMSMTLAQLELDLVDVQGLWMYPSLASLRYFKKHDRPYIVTPHGMLDPWALKRSAWKKRLVSWSFESQHLANANCLRATAPMEAGHFRAYGLTNPIAVVPNGIDLPALAPRLGEAGRKRRLLFLSRLHPKKGIDHLLRAWARLQSTHRDWELVIAGPDEVGHRADMQRLAAHLGARNVIWNEPVHGESKSALYRSADLFVLPTHAENFGLVVAEALAREVPVITTRNAPWQGLEQHGCGWWIDLDDRSLATALDAAMSLTDTERHAMGSRGRAWVEQDFAWPSIARQMHEVYTWVLGDGPPPSCVMTD